MELMNQCKSIQLNPFIANKHWKIYSKFTPLKPHMKVSFATTDPLLEQKTVNKNIEIKRI